MAFGTILVPYDASDAADAMLRLAFMAVRARGRVVAVHIARIPPALPLERSPDAYEWAGHIALDRAECIAADMGSGLETWMTRTRDPEEAILGEARKQEVDAIFLPRYSWRHPWRRLREARTVHAVLRRAPCAVLVGTAGRPIRPDPSDRADETTSGSDSSRRCDIPYGSFGIVETMNGTEPIPGTPVVRTLGMVGIPASPEEASDGRLCDAARMLILLIGGVETAGRFLGRDGAARMPGYYSIGLRERMAMAAAYFGLLGMTFAGMGLFHAQLRAVSGGAL